jgi:hypothetical protein
MGVDPISLGLIGGGLASGAGSFFGSQSQASAQKQAAALQLQMYNNNKAILQPFINNGTNADNLYANISGVNGNQAQSTAINNLATDPFISSISKFATDQTLAAAGRGGAGVSGNALSALYNNAANQYDSYLNQQVGYINNAANRGATAASSLVNAGANAANSAGNFTAGAGASIGSGIAGVGNALGNSLNNLGLISYLQNPSINVGANGGINQYTNLNTYGGLNYSDPYAGIGNAPAY